LFILLMSKLGQKYNK